MNKIDLTEWPAVVAAIPANDVARDVAHMTRPSEGLRVGHLHNILFALEKGPMIARTDDTHYVTYSTGDTGTLADMVSLHNSGLLSDNPSERLSEKGLVVLAYLNAVHGPSKWQASNGGPTLAQA